jgi:D-alanyl-D-alanine carboxypeptidase/D-alanyl-D-alanine-endopeptidase (penicillin-binding protein 4)
MSPAVRRVLGLTATGPVIGSVLAGYSAFAADGNLSRTDQKIAGDLESRIKEAGLGADLSAFVMDAESDREIFGNNASTALMPASNTKLATATAALTVLGPEHRFTTRVVYGDGTLTLIGGGDRVLTTDDLSVLAKTAADGLSAAGLTSVKVRVDDSLFPAPALAAGWTDGYFPDAVSPVRPLVVDGSPGMDTSLDAGKAFARLLADQGITTDGAVVRGATAATDVPVASHSSPPLSEIVEKMILKSDNNIAETLLRMTAIAAGQPATFEGGATAVRTVLTERYGLPLDGVKLFDGSGLSRSTRIPATTLADLLDLLTDPRHKAVLGPILEGLPVAGETGTLGPGTGRFDTRPSSCAASKVKAKTGTLTGALALSGLTLGQDGRWKVFSFIENGASADPADTKKVLDGLAATVNGCF